MLDGNTQAHEQSSIGALLAHVLQQGVLNLGYACADLYIIIFMAACGIWLRRVRWVLAAAAIYPVVLTLTYALVGRDPKLDIGTLAYVLIMRTAACVIWGGVLWYAVGRTRGRIG